MQCPQCGNPDTTLTSPDYGHGAAFKCYECNVYGHPFTSSSPEAKAASDAAVAISKANAAKELRK